MDESSGSPGARWLLPRTARRSRRTATRPSRLRSISGEFPRATTEASHREAGCLSRRSCGTRTGITGSLRPRSSRSRSREDRRDTEDAPMLAKKILPGALLALILVLAGCNEPPKPPTFVLWEIKYVYAGGRSFQKPTSTSTRQIEGSLDRVACE